MRCAAPLPWSVASVWFLRWGRRPPFVRCPLPGRDDVLAEGHAWGGHRALDRVDVQSFGRLRPGSDSFAHHATLDATDRACWPMRAIAEDHNAFVLLSAVRSWGSRPINQNLYTTHELVNGTWNISEFQVAQDLDYAIVPGGKLVRAYNDGTNLVIQVRDQVLNRPAKSTDRWSDILSTESLGYSDQTVLNDSFGVLVLPEFVPPVGLNVAKREFAVEVDYWRDRGSMIRSLSWSLST